MKDNAGTGQKVAVRFETVDENSHGQRLDNYLTRVLRGVPKGRIYKALRKGEIRVNKGRVKADFRLSSGDVVRIPPVRLADPKAPQVLPRHWRAELERAVVASFPGLLVVNKPSGLAVHGGSGLSFGLIEALRQMRPDDRYLELVHRLDKDTSGCLLIARKASVLKDLHRQLREGTMSKRYLALVAGRWPARVRQVSAPLEKNVLSSGERMVRVSAEGKPSLTEFSVVKRFVGATLIEARPVTGRTHQIRVHARHQGFPLLGDDKYSTEQTEQVAKSLGVKRLFLHASELHFDVEGQRQCVKAPLDLDLQQLIDGLEV